MNQTEKIRSGLKALCIYDFSQDPVLHALSSLLHHAQEEALAVEKWANFFKALCRADCADNFKGYLTELILTNDNCFTKAATAGTTKVLSNSVLAAVKQDLQQLEEVANLTPNDVINSVQDVELRQILSTMGKWETGTGQTPLEHHWSEQLEALEAHHHRFGYGDFAKYNAFAWREGALQPIRSSNPITLHDLKCYEKQRQKVVDNTESFVMGLPANNVLLYGERGTGKSSTVHAVLNRYAQEGLRMIEVPKSAIPEFPILFEKIITSPMRFIIFIDDLSFSSDDDSYASLKAALEGSISAKQSNTLIYATSNRRHLVKETFSARDGDELHRTDTIQETMSLSDRFGLSVTFLNPDRAKFFEILDKMVTDRALSVEFDKLHSCAERWALERGGRSPRTAKQFVDMVESKVKRNLEW